MTTRGRPPKSRVATSARGAKSVFVAATIFGLFLTPFAARAAAGTAGGSDVSLFTIAKSENKNEVQYAVHVDEHCAPIAGAPVFAYWHMLELGPTKVAPILPREVSAYGVASQKVTSQNGAGGSVRVVLRALPTRPIIVETVRAGDGACRAVATVTIGGAPAHLFNVYVKLKEVLGVDYLLARGWSLDGSKMLTERIKK